MRIITVNLPTTYLKAIDGLVGDSGLYPSRSELIRVAVRDYLIRELETALSFAQYQTPMNSTPATATNTEYIDNSFVRIPLGSTDQSGIPEYKTYRIVKKATRCENGG